MSWFRITLHRSAIGLPERTRGVLAALGLRRRSQVVFHPVSAQFAGMILKVKELVRVAEVDRPLTKAEVKAERTPDAGFYVERRAPGGVGRMDVGVAKGGKATAEEVRI
jgi:ribosomal protein L30